MWTQADTRGVGRSVEQSTTVLAFASLSHVWCLAYNTSLAYQLERACTARWVTTREDGFKATESKCRRSLKFAEQRPDYCLTSMFQGYSTVGAYQSQAVT